jgi:hypothetical protein
VHASFLLQVKLRLQTHYQNIESLVSIYEDVIVNVGKLSFDLRTLCLILQLEADNVILVYVVYIPSSCPIIDYSEVSKKSIYYQKSCTIFSPN